MSLGLRRGLNPPRTACDHSLGPRHHRPRHVRPIARRPFAFDGFLHRLYPVRWSCPPPAHPCSLFNSLSFYSPSSVCTLAAFRRKGKRVEWEKFISEYTLGSAFSHGWHRMTFDLLRCSQLRWTRSSRHSQDLEISLWRGRTVLSSPNCLAYYYSYPVRYC